MSIIILATDMLAPLTHGPTLSSDNDGSCDAGLREDIGCNCLLRGCHSRMKIQSTPHCTVVVLGVQNSFTGFPLYSSKQTVGD